MLRWTWRKVGLLAFGLLAYGAIFVGAIVLFAHRLGTLLTVGIFIVASLMLAAVRQYVLKRLAEREKQPR